MTLFNVFLKFAQCPICTWIEYLNSTVQSNEGRNMTNPIPLNEEWKIGLNDSSILSHTRALNFEQNLIRNELPASLQVSSPASHQECSTQQTYYSHARDYENDCIDSSSCVWGKGRDIQASLDSAPASPVSSMSSFSKKLPKLTINDMSNCPISPNSSKYKENSNQRSKSKSSMSNHQHNKTTVPDLNYEQQYQINDLRESYAAEQYSYENHSAPITAYCTYPPPDDNIVWKKKENCPTDPPNESKAFQTNKIVHRSPSSSCCCIM
ncbi:hypothetical protein BS50DRAFT_594467 [Corynespora cassiicola Philippines]|uniref:Uncharacterized protein n=1 Tax=Corynespora cassiicola Philippines TaxID=1448308 RepID=A0A2T2N2E7_CORCC|nr:hypothetical protein BS50DRAFT_594467 [Corynespora cassiicola Philippines]